MRMYQHKGPSPLSLFMLGFAIVTLVGLTTTATVSKENELINTEIHQKRVERDEPPRQPASNSLKHLLRGYNGLTGSENATHITRGNKTCLKISCTENHFVRSCDKNGGNDTCIPCAAGTFLSDKTSSILHNHECVTTPICFPEATVSRYPNYCGDHRTFCKCDIVRNFCGVDPCSCKVGHCTSTSAPVLNINCGCDRNPKIATTTTSYPSILTKATPPKIATTKIATTTTPSTTTVSTAVSHTSTKASTQTPSVQPHGEEARHSDRFGIGVVVGFSVCFIIIAAIITGVFVYLTKCRKKRDNTVNNSDIGFNQLSQNEDH